MKFLLFGLLALLCVSQLAAAREVRTYSNDVEYVDRVEVSPHATELPVAARAAEPSLMEATSSAAAPAAAEERPMQFFMENEAGAEDVWRELSSFVESSSSTEALAQAAAQVEQVDTAVARVMALEIHDAAQQRLDDAEGNMVLALVEAEAEAEVQAEAEAEAEAEAARKAALSPAELAQEKADAAAEKADRMAEQKDALEAAKDRKEAKQDKKILKATVAPAKAKKAKKTVVSIPADMRGAHSKVVRAQLAATRTVRGALGELNGILSAKDDAIRSLVHNVTYLTVNMGKLANQVDSQRAYIRALERQLAAARQKNLAMHRHVQHSHATAQGIRAQLAAVEQRLDTQDKATTRLSDYISHKKERRLPKHKDDLEVKRPKGKKSKKRSARRDRFQRRVMRLRPVQGTQTFATGQVPFPHYRVAQPTFATAPAAAPRTIASGYYSRSAAVRAPGVQPLPAPYGNIPTIVVEAADDGQ